MDLPSIEMTGLRIGLPAELWEGLDDAVKEVTHRGTGTTRSGRRQVGHHHDARPVAPRAQASACQSPYTNQLEDLPAWLVANHAPFKTVKEIAARIASPDVRRAYARVLAEEFEAQYRGGHDDRTPSPSKQYETAFLTHRVDAFLFPTTVLAASAA